MREILTICAAIVIVLLSAALGGPWLVDWTAHREFVDTRISQALGVNLKTRGAIDIKLLPTPFIALEGFDLQSEVVTVHAGATRFEMQVMPLMRGEFRFYDASVESPDVALRPSRGAAAPILSEASFDHVRVRDARLRLVDAAGVEKINVAGLDIDGEAGSLRGPFKGSGMLSRAAGAITFRFATGGVENDKMRLKLVSDEAIGAPRLDLDGALGLEGPDLPVFEGQAIISGVRPTPWRVAGPLHFDAAGATMDKLDARIEQTAGSDGAAISMQGALKAEFGDRPAGVVELSARQLDLDSLSNGALVEAIGAWLGQSSATADLPFALKVSLTTPAVMLGGESLSDVGAKLDLAPNAPLGVGLNFKAGPGGSRLDLSGAMETGSAATFRGHVATAARDLMRLADWAGRWAPDDAARLRALPVRGLDLQGQFALSAAGFSADHLTVKADRTTLVGAAAFTRAFGDERARFYADLTSDAFDLETAPDLSGPAGALADADLSISLNARAIRVARFGEGTIDAGRIRFRIIRDGFKTRLEDFSIADLGGASVQAGGDADQAGAHFNGAVSAERLGDLAAFLRRVAPGRLTDSLVARATALSPAKLTFRLDATRAKPDAPLGIATLSIDGLARGTAIKATAKPEGDTGALTGSLTLESADAVMLARQIGIDPGLSSAAGVARIELRARGSLERGFGVDASANAAGAALSFRGRVDDAAARGDVAIDSADAAPLLRLLGFGLPDVLAKAPAKLTARLTATNARTEIQSIAGSLDGVTIAGDLALTPEPGPGARGKWTGALRLDSLSLSALARGVLGPERSLKAGEIWSSTPFAAGMARMPLADIALEAGQVRLSENLALTKTRLRLNTAQGSLGVTDLEAGLPSGRLTDGRLTLRRDGANASLIAAFSVAGLAFAQPGFAANDISGSIEVSATGAAMSSLAGGLAGQGRFHLNEITIPRADPAAPGRVLARADAGDLYISENDFLGALRRELDSAPFKAGDRDLDAIVAGGVLKLSGAEGLSIAYDLRNGQSESRALLVTQPLPKDWDAPAPRIGVIWKGPLANPTRDLDAGAFNAALTARAVAREQERIEALEADARERAAFNRRLKGFAFMRTRDEEIATWEAEQERLAQEAEKRRLAEVARLEREKADRDRAEKERADRERRAADARARAEDTAKRDDPTPVTKPLEIAPLARPASAAPPPPGSDPSSAGRY